MALTIRILLASIVPPRSDCGVRIVMYRQLDSADRRFQLGRTTFAPESIDEMLKRAIHETISRHNSLRAATAVRYEKQ